MLRGFRITGKVQGVHFRHSARIEAQRLDLAGIARNLADGSVEVLVRGAPEAVAVLGAWLHRGPAPARVDAVEEFALDAAAGADLPVGFEVR